MMTSLKNIPCLLIILQVISHLNNCIGTATNHRVIVGGASGYIGRNVVKQLVARGITTAALVRTDPSLLSDTTLKYFEGAEVIQCDVLDASSTDHSFLSFQPTAVICCLASRSGEQQKERSSSGNILRARTLFVSEYSLLSGCS